MPETDRLPEPFRAAVVLCDLEGNSYDQAAEMLHCPVGTIQSRLSRGRQRLRRRLERRGLGSALALAGRGPLASPIALGVPQTLAQKVVWAAVSVAGGESIRGLAPAAVIGLVGSELRRHLLSRILTVVGTLWVAALVVAGVAMLTGGQLEKNRELQKATTNPSPRANSDPVHVRVVESRLLVANRQSSSSCVIDPRTRCVLAEHDVGCGLADIVALPDDRHVLAVDQAGYDILVLNAHADVIQVLARVQVSPGPHRGPERRFVVRGGFTLVAPVDVPGADTRPIARR